MTNDVTEFFEAGAGPAVRIGALELADRLGMDPPTEEQQLVIEAPLSPALVVAGAGSGKTATMANRVIWLLANGHVRVHEVLGLTFTRKAAGELGIRIAGHIDTLRAAGMLPDQHGTHTAAGAGAADGAGSIGAERAPVDAIFDSPTVSTYNSFANTIFRDNAVLVGRESESVLLGENAAWGLARRVVLAHGDSNLVPLGKKLNGIVDAVLELSHALSENVADPAGVLALAEQFSYLTELPYTSGRAKAAPFASVEKALAPVSALPTLIALAKQYAHQKQASGLVEFADQVALALEICEGHQSVVDDYRARFKVVLLDEYQDTSVVQTRLLSGLFAGHGVMAVGDPHQSIYGWRGASASNLTAFAQGFGAGKSVANFSLSTSWRNSRRVLDSANALVAPLRAESVVDVESLKPRPNAPDGSVESKFLETRDDEAKAVAEWIGAQLKLSRPAGAKPASAAMLFRVRSQMDFFAAALDEQGIPNHILGVGGLLSSPAVVDVVSALRATHDPGAGSALLRLLSGPHWRVGVHDLRALSQLAGWLNSTDSFHKTASEAALAGMRSSVAPEDGSSIVDALDFLAEARSGHSQLARFSETGVARLRQAGRTLASFRARAGLPLVDFVRYIEQELLLDVELAANESSASTMAGRPQGALDALHDEITSFLAADDEGTLSSFLSWLDRAEKHDDLSQRTEPPEPGTVQLLTIHGSKGLEWDIVAIPRVVLGEIPAPSKEGSGWLSFGTLPYEFRGDAADLPDLKWQALDTQQEFDGNLKAFGLELKERHLAEERRLIYVAVTRARTALLLSGSFWSTQTKPRPPSMFLAELADEGIIEDLPEEPESVENPLDAGGVTQLWPADPLGVRRDRVEGAAEAVLAELMLRSEAGNVSTSAGRFARDLELLLAERERAIAANALAPIPNRIAASRFKDFVTDPQAVARLIRRPMPEKPFRQTRLGTRFHSWVENRYGIVGGAEMIDAALGEQDFDEAMNTVEEAELARLQATFEASAFATRKPVEVEVEIHLVLAGRVVVCKIDAIFRDGDRYQVVDWKTGKAPKDDADLEVKQLQLALYRLAYARWKGIDPDLIDAAFYFVSDDAVIVPQRLYSEAELEALAP